MRQETKYQLWIIAAAGIIFLTNLGGPALWDMDEALYATCAREMLQRDNWVVPWFNGAMFPEKPPLMFWTMIAGFEIFGINEWGARFFSAIMGIGTALAAFHLGRILYNARVGLWTGLITASTIIFTISARAATVDCALTFVTTLAMLFFVLGWKHKGSGVWGEESVDGGQGSKCKSLSPLYAILAYAMVGLAVLGKGPVGMLLPLAAMGFFLVIVNGWRNIFRSAWWMRPITAIVVIAAVAAPWYVMVGIETQGEWLNKFIFDFNLRPFKKPFLGHGDTSYLDRVGAAVVSFLYYFYQIPAILCGFFPWSVFLGPTVAETYRRIRDKGTGDRGPGSGALAPSAGAVFALCWFGVWFVFWSICKTKLPHYLLPAYPALALLTALFVDRWLREPASLKPWELRNAWISTILVGFGILIAIWVVTTWTIYLPGEWFLGLCGLILVFGGAWCWREASHHQQLRAVVGFAVMSVAFLTAMFGFAVLQVDRYQNARPMIAEIRADWEGREGRAPIATYQFFRESTVHYAGYPVTKCNDAEELAKFFADSGRSYVVTLNEHEAELLKKFDGRLETIFRHPRFLGPGEMVVLRYDASGGGNGAAE